jgi:hypothetical protein
LIQILFTQSQWVQAAAGLRIPVQEQQAQIQYLAPLHQLAAAAAYMEEHNIQMVAQVVVRHTLARRV